MKKTKTKLGDGDKNREDKLYEKFRDFRCRNGAIGFLYSKINRGFELVEYYNNPYYNAQSRLEAEGYETLEDGSMRKENLTINESCFKNEESCIVLSFFMWDINDDYFDLRTVGTRPFEVKDMDDLKNVIEYVKRKTPEICAIMREVEEKK